MEQEPVKPKNAQVEERVDHFLNKASYANMLQSLLEIALSYKGLRKQRY